MERIFKVDAEMFEMKVPLNESMRALKNTEEQSLTLVCISLWRWLREIGQHSSMVEEDELDSLG